ncbi:MULTISPECIES: bifunctional UDP-sugar hydrolase/5'-nucleotidase [unclassified Wenzhouxiangella]|uniref:bifunctional metallophosphatase/5'-nucleotidase n=1 Tax=unclassified Wenzhouxiangella TaxID=2613841 RepID=UPI000E329E09|nr:MULTISPECIES: 5'-nucleotidase C-terminal domain-containing protein [unclassified Wenzhouxiangella]RFF26970.1 bifunctional metallophosphatase/5'-nucleotidase [Wenzhouxiangella sp. 15181]RFP69482.1 bifunctional metallophosphatase/5'-nucleotidase [Wenzhouxiangella sp. 15190]
MLPALRDSCRALIAVVLAAGLLACSQPEPRPEPVAGDERVEGLELQLLHFADIDGGGTGALEHVAEFSALVASFRAKMPERTLLISSGDNYVPGPVYQASNDPAMAEVTGAPGVGRGEIAFLNAMDVDVSAVGNHDLDGGPEEFAAIIQPNDGWPGSRFPWLSTNLDFAGDPQLADLVSADGLHAEEIDGRLAGSAVLEVDGRRIGVVGASTPTLDQITSTGDIGVRPADADDIEALAGIIQDAVDELAADGVDIIILAAHMQQLHVERALAERLEHVDVVIGGGSNTILADSDSRLHPGDAAVDDYPVVYRSPLEEPVLLVNTDGDYRYLGRLLLPFDAEGVIELERLDAGRAGVWPSNASMVEERDAEPIPEVVAIRDAFWRTLEAKEGHVLGYTDRFLDGRRTMVRTRETNLGRLWAKATLWLGRKQEPEAVVAFRNGGGIRGPIGEMRVPPGSRDASTVRLGPPAGNRFRPEGSISRLDLETALAFNGELVALTVTAGELYDIMEYAVSGIAPGATPGWFPQFAGLRLSYDASRPARRPLETGQGDINQGANSNGERVRELAVVAPDGTTTQLISEGKWMGDPEQRFRVISLAFLAQCVPLPNGQDQELSPCGDGYPLRGLSDPQRRNLVGLDYPEVAIDFVTPGTEQYALTAYLAAFHGTPERAIQLPPQPKGKQAWLTELSGRHD